MIVLMIFFVIFRNIVAKRCRILAKLSSLEHLIFVRLKYGVLGLGLSLDIDCTVLHLHAAILQCIHRARNIRHIFVDLNYIFKV